MARKIALMLGLFVALLPYLGFPESLDSMLYTISGLVITFLAWSGKRPPSAPLDEMEGELGEITDGGPQKSTDAPAVAKASVPEEKSVEQTIISTPPPLDHQDLPNDRTLAVAFTKQRQRNLNKRITQEGSQTPS
jgi:hypothetical protein